MTEKTSRLVIPHIPNRAERRRMQRAAGYRGKKSKKNRLDTPQIAQEAAETQAAIESQQKVIESAQGLRQLSAGRFWLPGDDAR